jgi:hypothetical protein
MGLSGLLWGLLFSIWLFLSGPTWAAECVVVADFSSGVDSKGVPTGWYVHERSGKADFSVIKDGDIHALQLRSADTSFALQRGVDVNTRDFPLLSWKWKVTQLPQGGDFRRSRTDDQAAQLFLGFSNRKAIVYIWDTTAPEGLIGDAWAPPLMTIKAIVIRSGYRQTGKWITETRNVHEDYRSLFGHEPPTIGGIRLQINSQHTDTSGESYFADVVFLKQ